MQQKRIRRTLVKTLFQTCIPGVSGQQVIRRCVAIHASYDHCFPEGIETYTAKYPEHDSATAGGCWT